MDGADPMNGPCAAWNGRSGPGSSLVPVLLGALLAGACTAEPEQLPPLPEALIAVSTDAPVPSLISRLRIDVYTPADMSWLVSREFALINPGDWPASFSLYSSETEHEHPVLLRLRAYPEGRVRDYHGERFSGRWPDQPAWAPSTVPVPEGEVPRLVVDGTDVTPADEPQPFATIDRLTHVVLRPGQRGSVSIVLRGACFGTMSDLWGWQTCIDTPGERVPAPVATLALNMSPARPDLEDFASPVPCPNDAVPRPGRTLGDGTRLFDEEACVLGGAFLFGDPREFGQGDWSGIPEHVVRLSPFYVDHYEVTVGRWRDAMSRGFAPPPNLMPIAGPDELNHDTCKTSAQGNSLGWCTWTTAVGGREEYPLNCVSHAAARAFCQFEGGDLITEAQWEYVAQVVGRDGESAYPWGEEPPVCNRTVVARLWTCNGGNEWREGCMFAGPVCSQTADTKPDNGDNCGQKVVESDLLGPQPEYLLSDVDLSLGLGVSNLGGSMSELTRDAFHSLDSNCWASVPQLDPWCADDETSSHAVRGGSWAGLQSRVASGKRASFDPAFPARDYYPPQIGFRCVRPVELP